MADLWAFVPLPAIGETLSFATEIAETPEAEYRRSRRPARRRFDYRFGTSGELQRMEQMVRRNLTGVWDVPIWTESSKPGPVLSTDTEIAADLNASYTDRALVWGDCDDWVIVEIAAITDVLELAAPIGQGFENPSVMPVKLGIAPPGLSTARKGYEFFDVGMAFEIREADEVEGTDLPQYQGLDYVECAGSFSGSSGGSAAWLFDRSDNQEASVDLIRTTDLFRRRFDATFVMETAAKRRSFALWLNRLRGRDRPFWVPLPAGDMALQEPAATSATSILVEPMFDQVTDYVGRHVSLSFGQMREITAAAVEGFNVRLTVAALTEDATLPTLIAKVRLDSDSIDITHQRHFYARTTLTFAEVI